jgi:dienelactone hydrolase
LAFVELEVIWRARELTPGKGTARLRVALVVLVAAGSLAACSAAAGGTHTGSAGRGAAAGHAGQLGHGRDATSASRGPVGTSRDPVRSPTSFGVGLGIVTWDETQGYTENFYEGTTQSGRVMQVEILYPTLVVKPPAVVPLAMPAYRFGPYPVIVFAHGFDVDPNTYRALLASWAEAGYVVVAPFFPDTSLPAIEAQHGVDTESDMFNQPADVAFVVSQVDKAAKDSPLTRVRYLAGMMNPARLVLAGQSDGGDTIAALMYDHAYASTRASMPIQPVALALLSGAEWTRAQDVYSAPSGGGPPVLVVQSLTDSCNDPAYSSQLYNMLTESKWFLALEDATHLGPYVGVSPAAPVVEKVTVGFFDLATGRRNVTTQTLAQEGNQPGISTITSAASVPLYPAPTWVADGCLPPPGTPTA